jgi:hypothetical protein
LPFGNSAADGVTIDSGISGVHWPAPGAATAAVRSVGGAPDSAVDGVGAGSLPPPPQAASNSAPISEAHRGAPARNERVMLVSCPAHAVAAWLALRLVFERMFYFYTM